MAFVSNPGLLAAAFIEGSAAFILLVLYWLLAPGFPKRFFHYWIAGWTAYVALGAMRILSLWRNGQDNPRFSSAVSLVVAVLLFAAILECTGNSKKVQWLWPLAVIGGSVLAASAGIPRLASTTEWAQSLSESGLYLVAGWMLWRSNSRHSGFGWKLLSGALMLRALHGVDRPEWPFQMLGLFRVSFHGLFGIAMGIAMAVLVLEAGRARTEELNEKLRRLALMTAEATHSSRPRETLDGVLQQLVKNLNASHGVAFFLDPGGGSKALSLEASVGFSDVFRSQHKALSPGDAWVERVLRDGAPFEVAEDQETDAPKWMGTEQLKAMVLVRIPGKDAPLGILGVGSAAKRSFEKDEEHFLVNVANLLGLTWQNLKLFESAASARRQWLDTFDSISDLILVHSPDGLVLRMNRSLAWHLGLEPALVEGQYVKDLFQKNDGTWDTCPYCEGAAGDSEEPDPAFGGYFFVTNSDFHDSDGNLLGTIHVLKDFTERRQAENRFRALFEKAQEGVFVSTPEGRFLDFNDALLRFLGYESREELLAVDIPSQTYVEPSDRDRLNRLLREHGEVTDFEFRFRRRDGEIRVARETSFVERDDSGKITAYQGFVLDITERKQAEMEIRRRNRELLALNAIAGMLGQAAPLEEVLTRVLLKVSELFAADTGSIYFLDEQTMKLRRAAATGHRSDAARNLLLMQVSAALIQQVRQAHATVISASALAVPETLREAQRAEGIAVTQVVILWAKERIVGALVVGCRAARDFSTAELNLLAAVGNQIAATIDKSRLLEETREAYDTLRRTQEQLLQSEKMAAVGQLISGVAHELNNPLTAILGYSQLLKSEELVDARSADYLEKLYKQAQRTHHIVQNLLSFSRQHKPERAAVQLNQILDDTLILREYDLKLHNIQVHREFDPQLPFTGGDFNQLQQVFLNILNNAVDAIQEKGGKGEIWIRTGIDAGRIRVDISDNGSGLKDPHRVFDPFYTTKPVGKGTGLGLSICYGIIKEHGGEILARNSPPQGASFTIVLPILAVDAPSLTAGRLSRTSEPVRGTVLLVDDEDAVLHVEQEILRPRGISVKTAHSAREAIEFLTRNSVDAVVTDLAMPGDISAADLFRWIRQHRPDLAGHIVFTASNPHEGADKDLIRNSGCPVVRKPFALEDFWNAVQKILTADVSSS